MATAQPAVRATLAMAGRRVARVLAYSGNGSIPAALHDISMKPAPRILGSAPEGGVLWDGDIQECTPPRRLVTTFRANWRPELAADRPNKCTYEIMGAMAGVAKLTVLHENPDGETPTQTSVAEGWMVILSGLKTLIETGEPMAAAGAKTVSMKP